MAKTFVKKNLSRLSALSRSCYTLWNLSEHPTPKRFVLPPSAFMLSTTSKRFMYSRNSETEKDLHLTAPYFSDNGNEITELNDDLEDDDESSDVTKVACLGETLSKCRSLDEAIVHLDGCVFQPSTESVYRIICRFQNNWKAALAVFHWSSSQPGYSHRVVVWHAILSVLGMHKQFSLAWGLIKKMHEKALVSRHTLRIMIKWYAAADDVTRAIRTFYGMDKFRLASEYDDFLWLLHLLCEHKFIEESEELIYRSRMYFPIDVKSFNIILNAWCNIVDDRYQVKRIWEGLYDLCISPDATSYTIVICYYSKVGKFYDVVRLYDEMKKKGYAPTIRVLNSVFNVLAKENCVKEALNLFNRIEDMDLKPDMLTYSCLVNLLCQTWNSQSSWKVLDDMIQAGFTPNLETYHQFFRFVGNKGDIYKLFDKIIKTGSTPSAETFIISIRKCCSWANYKDSLKLLNDMEIFGFIDNLNALHLVLNAFFPSSSQNDVCRYYFDLKATGFPFEPNVTKYFESWKSQEAEIYG